MQLFPAKVEIVGNYLAIRWRNNKESIIEAKILRENSPSAENKGETDLFGNLSQIKNANTPKNVQILKFERIGNYAIRIVFSDGHSSGIYHWSLLKDLGN